MVKTFSGVGIITKTEALDYGFTGVMLRGAGLIMMFAQLFLRCLFWIEFSNFCRTSSRLFWSVSYSYQWNESQFINFRAMLNLIEPGDFKFDIKKLVHFSRKYEIFYGILINHFKIQSEGFP